MSTIGRKKRVGNGYGAQDLDGVPKCWQFFGLILSKYNSNKVGEIDKNGDSSRLISSGSHACSSKQKNDK